MSPWPLAARIVPSGEKARAMWPSRLAGRSAGAAPRRCAGPRSGRCRCAPRRRDGRRGPGPRCRPSPCCCGTSPGVGRRGRPELDGPVQASRGGQRAVGTEGHAVDEPGVAVERGVFAASARSQRRTLLSSLPETSCLPSGENARPRTKPRWPIRVCRCSPVAAVPEPDGLVPAAGGHAPAVRAERRRHRRS